MESGKNKIVSLPFQALTANDYNPNEMTEDEFAELVSEVKHLGRLPKPIIVRPNGDGYVIVDGEHGWRAAQEVKLPDIPCEVVEADNFEAMRQTYKRNQHGTHNPVRLGKMFKKMKKERNLSNRALAKEIEVSEGTIRNAILYADAAEMRNDYAFENLSVKQIRYAGMLPERVRNLWLDSGADIPALFNAIAPKGAKQLISKTKRDIESWLGTYGPPEWEMGSTAEEAFFSFYHFLIEGGLFETYLSDWHIGSTDRFIMAFQKAVKWFEFEKKHFPEWGSHSKTYRDLRTQWRKFIISFFNVGWKNDDSAFRNMDKILAMIFDSAGPSFLITPEEFEEICEKREFKNTDDLSKIVKIAVYEKHGNLLEQDPRYNAESFTETLQKIEIKEKAPDYIKKSPLVTHLKYALWKSDGPDWAKQQLAKKSYISFEPQKDIDELVEKKEFQETDKTELAKRIAGILHKSNEKDQTALAEKLILLGKIELLAICEAVEHYNQF